MQIPKELNTVTHLSKTVALVLFVTLPIIAFLFGMRYQAMLIEQGISISPAPIEVHPTSKQVACTMDAKLCPDGTSVGRVAPNCEFEECPTVPQDGIFCGGIAGKMCPSGYYCKYDGTYPDAGGTCMR